MPLITLPFETWPSVVAVLRADGWPPWMRELADRIERMLDEHGPVEAEVALFLDDDMYFRSYNTAPLELGIPLPPLDR